MAFEIFFEIYASPLKMIITALYSSFFIFPPVLYSSTDYKSRRKSFSRAKTVNSARSR